jgi:nucleotide-binding universal stress UspA family protein
MKRILLPTDFSENSLNAIKYTLALFKNVPCDYYLLNVYKVPYLTNEELMENDAQQLAIVETELFEQSRNNLEVLREKIGDQENSVFHLISDYNFLSNSVNECVKNKEIELVAMGTKGATGAKEIFLGSNTGDVLMKTDSNVLAIPENAKFQPVKEIVFPTDYRIKYELDDLASLIMIAELYESSIRVLHLNEENVLDEEQMANKRILESYFKPVHHTYHVLTNTDFEEALNCFTQSRGDVDMIAIISRHYNFLQRLFFRPKVMELSFHTKIPMFVMHHRKK